jgi:hypothetical protein
MRRVCMNKRAYRDIMNIIRCIAAGVKLMEKDRECENSVNVTGKKIPRFFCPSEVGKLSTIEL